ncbi:chondroitin lyase [Maribellus comscasis]|uniref:Chondroitin lyase n=1 Tax=Maribellus comscasis TaxID=2681766 RepID=A0A6I6JNE1_9BACT|nr:polysaccharide lyase family 8 super-sandwich domain-containing protein [Maribellus comscasis]QGY42588.1 chondroitin lyase [Maribellus comscasis]
MKNILPVLIIALFIFSVKTSVSADSDLDTIEKRVFETLENPDVDDAEIASLLRTFTSDGKWPGINYEDVSRTGFEHRNHSGNMVTLARAYQKKDSKYYKSGEVKSTISAALKTWVDNDYICDNWWHNQIGTPNNLVTLMVLAGDELPEELVKKAQPIIGRANISAGGARPGGDRIKIAGIEAKNMLFLGNREKFDEVIKVIEGEIKHVEWIGNDYGFGFRRIVGGFDNRSAEGRGIQYDNSFHHRTDGVNNTLSYGLGYADAFVEWAVYTNGTKYAFSEEKLEELINYFLDGICKTCVFGKYPDPGAKNRSISREGTLKPYSATTAENLLKTTDYRKKELQEIVDIRNKGIKTTLSHATFFWDSEHFSFQRPDWFTSVRMYSTRVYNMEWPYNSEGLLNHHRGDGVNHVSLTGDEYFDIWPVYDYLKIPGTTVMQKPEFPSENEIQKLGETDFVGAVTDGIYGAAAFDFKSPHDPLIARKAWFFFDNEYVCLGTGISCRNNDFPVFTTLNQCLLRDDVTVSANDISSVVERGKNKFENVDWIFQDGVGYVFPNPAIVNIENEAATGSWWKINKQSDSPKDQMSLDVFSVWLDHGKRPSNKTYEYIIVPATTIGKLERNVSKNNIEILVNTAEIQAVKNKESQICQVVFYKAGELEISNNLKLVSEHPGIVMLKMEGDKVSKITVADPNRELDNYHLSISQKITNPGEYLDATWNAKENLTNITIRLPRKNYRGASVSIKL